MKCKEKQAYITKTFAKKIKRIAQKEYHKRLTVYKCAECWLYHFCSWSASNVAHFRKIQNKIT